MQHFYQVRGQAFSAFRRAFEKPSFHRSVYPFGWVITKLPPMILGEWIAIVRIEQHIPAQLDKQMLQRLLDDLFETWLQQELVQLASNGSIALNVVETDLSQPQLL